tara:strand:- start:1157 stop:1852 length:696 start_codon:yes stop_codon:yes gene_type:complete
MQKYINANVIILCGGKGQRLKPITESIPKPMVEIKSKPILGHILEYLNKYKFNSINIATGYKSSLINKYIEERSNSFEEISLFDTGDVDILDRIKAILKQKDGDFIVLYGDTLSDVDFEKLFSFHETKSRPATMTVWQLTSSFGIVEFDENFHVKAFLEKPKLDKYMNIGYFYFNQSIVEVMNQCTLWEEFLNKMVESDLLSSNVHDGLHITVNTLDELKYAEENIKSFKG